MEFKPGDKIICIGITSGYSFNPKIGAIYTVSEHTSPGSSTYDFNLVVEDYYSNECQGRNGLMNFSHKDFVLANLSELERIIYGFGG